MPDFAHPSASRSASRHANYVVQLPRAGRLVHLLVAVSSLLAVIGPVWNLSDWTHTEMKWVIWNFENWLRFMFVFQSSQKFVFFIFVLGKKCQNYLTNSCVFFSSCNFRINSYFAFFSTQVTMFFVANNIPKILHKRFQYNFIHKAQ